MPPLQTQKINPRTKRLEEMAQRFVSPGGLREFYTKAIAEDLAALEAPPKLHRYFDYYNLSHDYLQMAQFQQLAGDTAACKESFRLAARHRLEACRCFDDLPPETRERCVTSVNLRALPYFQGAALAGDRDLALELGRRIVAADQTGLPRCVQALEETSIRLYAGEDEAVRANCAFIRENKGKLWTCKTIFQEMDILDALLDRDGQRFYDAFVVLFRRDRRDPYIDLLDMGLIMLGRIALSRGLEFPLDTMECPRALMLPD
ncbi:MAG: hypothetical protein HFF10_11475 [Angelakisella sp.]|jgi:tetratricopeptide (TPR) repeat protein|nr:hypothetical protein [Angelakisella sp.]